MAEEEKHLQFRTILDEHPLRIEATPGTSRRLMVSFTSVGQEREEWPSKEFVAMASQEGQNHVLCVSDISRSWLNADGMERKIITHISDYILDHGITSLMMMGISMGAHNALVIGRKMPAECIIAFAPQYSVHPDVVPEEKRWWWFRKQIECWPNRELDALPGPPSNVFIFHGDTTDERMHWKKFPEAENVRHYIFCGADHNFALRLKESDTLSMIANAAINNRLGRMSKIAARVGGTTRARYDEFAAAIRYFDLHGKAKRPASLEWS